MESLASVLIFSDAVFYNATGLLFVVLGVYLLIRVTGFPDLTVDGSFTMGAALYAASLVAGWSTPAAVIIAAIGGAVGGLLTWLINSQLGVGKVVSSVLSMIILTLSAPYISGGTTISLLRLETFHAAIDRADAKLSPLLIGNQPYQTHFIFSGFWLALFSMVLAGIIIFLSKRLGLQLRYFGSAENSVLVTTARKFWLPALGLTLGNLLVAVGGAIEAQRRGGFTVNMGTGMILVAIAILILGEALAKSFLKREYLSLYEHAFSVIVGTIIYCAGIQILLALQIPVVDLRLLTALFLLVLLGIAGYFHSSTTRLF